MHKVLLVEDEPIVRVALKTLVDWSTYNFDMSLEANNGKQALELLHRNRDIDIVITDINMPIMDGLQLIEAMNKLKDPPVVIVLSAYDDYGLVRKAFKLGIYDYILKIEMEPENVLELLQKVVLEKERTQQKHGKTIHPFEKRLYLKQLLENNSAIDINEERMASYQLSKENLTLCYIWIDDYKQVEERYEKNTLKSFVQGVVETINHILISLQMGEVIDITPDAYVVLLSFQTNSELEIRQKVDEIMKKIRHAILHYLNVSLSVGVSRSKYGYGSLPALYEEALSNAKLRYVLGKGKNIYADDTSFIKQHDKESIIGKEESLLVAIKNLDKRLVEEELEKLLQLIGRFKIKSIEEAYTYYMELIFIIIYYLRDIEEDVTNIFEHNTDFYNIIQTLDTKEEVDRWVKNFVHNILDYLMDKYACKNNHIVNQAKQFIEDHYMTHISLLDVSNYIGLSEGYFSNLFTRETGVTFVQYLTSIRIEKSKEMLRNTNLKIYEICERIGYENVEHFSRVFKKDVGVSPKQYQKRH